MQNARVEFDVGRKIGVVDDRLYGSFIEHLGRAVYTGIYEPAHPLADGKGFRKDVAEAVRALRVPVIRYPGGNFVSGYNWEDGIGPQSERPRRLDLAWQTIETNEVGLHEFAEWCGRVGAEIMMAVNLGTRGIDDARRLMEYCNFRGGTALSDLRIDNGRKEPFGIKLWCLGNEMDGEWQIGHKSAREYGKLAAETSKLLKTIDPSAQTVACGSSSREMATYRTWEREVLRECYDSVDYLSLHQYYEPLSVDGDHRSYLTLADRMDSFIREVVEICDEVGKEKNSDKKINLSFDEWNVWYRLQEEQAAFKAWQIAPRLLENSYTFRDCVLFATLLNTLINHCDRVKIACLAQLVNVIAPIMTEPGGGMYLQTIYYPYYYASLYGRGEALSAEIDAPVYDCSAFYGARALHVAGVRNRDEFFVMLVNRGETDMRVTVSLHGARVAAIREYKRMKAENDARNSLQAPYKVVPCNAAAVIADGGVLLEAPAESVHFLRLTL